MNKYDLVDKEERVKLEKHFSKFNRNVITISAETGYGIDYLTERLVEILDEE